MPQTTSRTLPPQVQMTRQDAIEFLRRKLTEMTDDDHSACEIAAQRGIMCRGFKRYSDTELRRRYYWLADRRPGMSREDLEDLANRWQLARQLYHDLPCACDVQQIERDACLGWTEFENETLQQFLREIVGVNARVV